MAETRNPLPDVTAPMSLGNIGEFDVEQLIADARAGHPQPLGELVTSYTPVLWQVARHQGLDRASSEDVVQTAWLRLVRNPAAVRSSQALLGWLITVTRREAWRVSERNRREPATDDVALATRADVAPTPEQRVAADDRDSTLWAAVGKLPPRCQELLRIVAFVHRPDYDSVARAIGMPHGSIGPTRGRCLAKLRTLLIEDANWSAS